MSKRTPIRITESEISRFPKLEKLLDRGKVKFDATGRLRYLHGAPVGDMIYSGDDKNGEPVYRESAEDWFDPESPKAERFIWPT